MGCWRCVPGSPATGTAPQFYVSGSGTLVRALLRDGLIDDLHLFVYPVAVGRGQRLWSDDSEPTTLRLKEQDRYDNGVVHLNYGPARSAGAATSSSA